MDLYIIMYMYMSIFYCKTNSVVCVNELGAPYVQKQRHEACSISRLSRLFSISFFIDYIL